MEVKKFEKLTYILKYPKNYEEGKKYPVIIFLHGAGGRGDDIELVRTNPFFNITNKYDDFPFIVTAPQCCTNTWFDAFETLKRLTLSIYDSDFTDKEHFYAMGASMGGYASWQLAMSMPDLFAAIAPICGGGMYWNAARLVNVPVWAFHGALDGCVFPEESRKMVDGVNNAGGSAKLTIYPNNNHDAWSDTYANKEVFEWLLSNKNGNEKEIEDYYKDSKIYG